MMKEIFPPSEFGYGKEKKKVKRPTAEFGPSTFLTTDDRKKEEKASEIIREISKKKEKRDKAVTERYELKEDDFDKCSGYKRGNQLMNELKQAQQDLKII